MLSNGNKQHREHHYTSCPELINTGNSDLSKIDWASFISEVSDLRLLRVQFTCRREQSGVTKMTSNHAVTATHLYLRD